MRPFRITLAALAALWPIAASAADADRLALESARYLFDIEGEAGDAHRILDRLENSTEMEVRTQAQYLRGRFREEAGDAAGAIQSYTQALSGRGLAAGEKRRLYSRLLELNPDAVQPMRLAGRAGGLPSRVLATAAGGSMRYVLVEEAENPDSQPARVSWQDVDGMLHPLDAPLAPGEDVLDATPELLLTAPRDRQSASLRRGPDYAAAAPIRFAAESGWLFPGETEEVLLIGSEELRLFRRDQVVFSHPLPGIGCAYHPSAPRSRQGILFCPNQGVYRADFSRRTLQQLPLADPPSEVVVAGDHLALRYLDRLEMRRGPAFETVLWTQPAEMQDQLVLSRRHVLLAGVQGRLRAHSLRTGQLEWQRDDGISAVVPSGGELFAVTHARVCIAMDEKGRDLFAYEAGWGPEPLLLPSQDWLVVHRSDGRRVRLNRDLLRLTGNDRGYLFHSLRGKLKRRDMAGARATLESLLELEPGNGAAWKEMAQVLRAAGGSRKDIAEAWLQAARSQSAAPWSADPALGHLAQSLGADWVWKRQMGPRFFPSLVAGRRLAFYVENDNQTLVLLDHQDGSLQSSFRFPEALDLKAAGWIGDTAVVSSPTRLYLLAPLQGPGVQAQIPLPQPICQALVLPEGVAYSDWSGNLRLVDLPSRRLRWEIRLSHNGLLLSRARGADFLDVFEIEGGYHGVQLSTGRSQAQVRLPPGTITESHAGRQYAFAGFNEGLLLAVDRERGAIAWQKDMGEQIFSMAGRGDALLVGTASKWLFSVQGTSGAVQSQAQLPTYLFNRPLLVDDGYWVGTTAPALEKRSLSHALLQRLSLTDMPGTPSLAGNSIAVATLDNFILSFPNR